MFVFVFLVYLKTDFTVSFLWQVHEKLIAEMAEKYMHRQITV